MFEEYLVSLYIGKKIVLLYTLHLKEAQQDVFLERNLSFTALILLKLILLKPRREVKKYFFWIRFKFFYGFGLRLSIFILNDAVFWGRDIQSMLNKSRRYFNIVRKKRRKGIFHLCKSNYNITVITEMEIQKVFCFPEDILFEFWSSDKLVPYWS